MSLGEVGNRSPDLARPDPLAYGDSLASAAAGLASQLERERRQAERRRRIGAANRRLAWLVLPFLVAALAVHYSPGGRDAHNGIVLVLQWVFVPLVLVHTALSFYVFGWVPPSRTLRVFHIWFGYAYLVFMLASQTTFAWPALHGILTLAMFVSLAVHVGIGVHYALRRRRAAADRVGIPA